MPKDPHSLLSRLTEDTQPSTGAKERISKQFMQRIDHSALFERARKEAAPEANTASAVWASVYKMIDSPVVTGVFGRLKSMLGMEHAAQDRVRLHLLERIAPLPARQSYRTIKWVSAFAIFALALRISPVLFLAPATVAESVVILLPTKGSVELSLHDLWQPVSSELILNEPVSMRSGEGEGTILLHDDGTIRLAAQTSVTVHDLTDRPEPALDGPTLTLHEGQVWVQGLLSRNLRAITIATPYGTVSVHAGSVSIAVDERALTVSVFDRHAVVLQQDTETVIVAGHRVRFGAGTAGQLTAIQQTEYTDSWVAQNLNRDAVHRIEIAQMQRERRAARAGILPTSAFYPVKRVAEKVDVLLTLDPKGRIEKQLKQASVRLDEAAVLLAEGKEEASGPLEEYKQNIVALASGTGGDAVTQFLVKQEVAENTAELSAALPDDQLYALKKAVLETSVQLPDAVVNPSEIASVLLVDNIDELHTAIESGNAEKAEETYALIQPYLEDATKTEELLPDVRKEVISLLTDAAEKLQESHNATGASIASSVQRGLSPFLPSVKEEVVTAEPLTEQQVIALVERMLRRIEVYSVEQARLNQLVLEMSHFKNHQDEGRILRRLLQSVEEDSLRRTIRNAIQRLRVEVEG